MTVIRTFCDIRGVSPHLNARRLRVRLRNYAVAALPYLPGFGLVLAAVVWGWR